jgi:wobble nucleotide-excising tRNase
MKLGTESNNIDAAESQLKVAFPDTLKDIWLVSNGLELPDDWRLYPVFDSSNPRKTANHIVYENTKARWDYMSNDLVSIAEDGSGNHLVLKKHGGVLLPEIHIWDHETNEVERWSQSLDDILILSKKRVEDIEMQVERGTRTNV